MTSTNIFMLCRGCLELLDTVKELKSHVEYCKEPYKNKDHLKKILNTNQLTEIKYALEFEKLKSSFLGKYLQKVTGISYEDVLSENRLSINENNQNQSNIEIRYDLKEKPDSKQKISPVRKISPSRKKLERFTKIKNIETTKESIMEEKRQDIVSRIVKEDKSDNKDEIMKSIETMFLELKKENNESNIKNITLVRNKLLKLIDPNDYEEILRAHYMRIKEYFSNLGLNGMKHKNAMKKAFNTVECRLLELDSFYNYSAEPDHINWYISSIKMSKFDSFDFLPFQRERIFKRCLNYSLCVSSIIDIMKRELFNSYGFNSIIYIKLSNTDDKYSFYYLDKIDKSGKRCWRMDCRLEELVTDIIDNFLDYCCEMFRKYYITIFGDNDYRDNFLQQNSFTELECEQLLQNIVFLSNTINVYTSIQTLIETHSTYKPTDNDKFNLKADDKVQLKRYNELKKTDWKEVCLIKLQTLFDTDCKNILSHITI